MSHKKTKIPISVEFFFSTAQYVISHQTQTENYFCILLDRVLLNVSACAQCISDLCIYPCCCLRIKSVMASMLYYYICCHPLPILPFVRCRVGFLSHSASQTNSPLWLYFIGLSVKMSAKRLSIKNKEYNKNRGRLTSFSVKFNFHSPRLLRYIMKFAVKGNYQLFSFCFLCNFCFRFPNERQWQEKTDQDILS